MTDPTAPSTPAPAPPHVPAHAAHAAPRGKSLAQQPRLILGAAIVGVVAVVVLIVVLVSGGSSPSGFKAANPGVSSKVADANSTALKQIDTYNTTVSNCNTNIGCIELADRTLGDQLHVYANYIGTLHETGAAGRVVTNTLNTAQTTANTFEIVGDAQPTKANYDKVLHNFSLSDQLDKLKTAINNLTGVLNA